MVVYIECGQGNNPPPNKDNTMTAEQIWTEIETLRDICHRGTGKEEAAFKRLVDALADRIGAPAELPTRQRQRLIAIVKN